jgi:endonuclease YncB( thermonuclease family)
MNKNKQLFLFIAFFLILLAGLIALILLGSRFSHYINSGSSLPDNYVTQIIDGDTFQINTGEIVRLLCVDTPEKNQTGYEEAKYYLESLILNKEVILQGSITNTDKYLRILRYVYLNESGEFLFINKMILDNNYGELLIIPPEKCEEVK